MKRVAPILLSAFFSISLIAGPAYRKVEPHEVTASEVNGRARDGRHILLRTAIFDPGSERPDYQSFGLPRATGAGEYAVLQFQADHAGAKAELERLGVKFFGYLPDNAYQVRMSPKVRAALATHAEIRWIGDYEPGFKVHPRLWPKQNEQIREVRVVPFPDSAIQKTIELLKRTVPGVVVTRTLDDAYAHFVEVSIPEGTLNDFVRRTAAIDGVSWIEPNDRMHFHNFNSSGAIQGNQLGTPGRTIFAHNITGTGQIIAVADSGLDSDMCFFRGLNGHDAVTDATRAETAEPGPLFPQNKVIGYWVQQDADPYDLTAAGFHGTHTSGTVAGDNSAHPSSSTDAGIDPGDGMAPNAQILFQDIGRNDETGSLTGGDPYVMFLQALRGGARVHSNSYGSASKGAYTAYDQLVDQFLFDHNEMTVVFSAGNDGPTRTSTGSPANAKNVITVGATRSGVSTVLAAFSSQGPTVDGRIKPDIVAPGQDIFSASGDENHSDGNCGQISKQGTSMSAPTVAGGAVLVRQYFADGYYPTGTKRESDRLNASATLVKAVLLNGTLAPPTGSDFAGPRYGWGKILLDNNLYFPGDARKVRVWDIANGQGLTTGESATFTVSVATGEEFRATLAWTDPEGTLGAAKSLVNDLDLSATRGAETFAGNVFDTTGNSVAGGSADRTNNVEQIRFVAPVGGTYTITVRATSVPGNGRSGTNRQGFALVVSSANCTSGVSAGPQNLQVRTNTTRGSDLTWSKAAGTTSTQIYRAAGTNPDLADFRYIGSSTGSSFTDQRAQGGYTFTYRLRGADDCGEGPLSDAVTFTATGLCDLAPAFSGVAVAQPDGNNCRINLSWGSAQSSCPLGPSIRYHIYRSTAPDFVPSGTPYATTSATTFSDISIATGTTYYYIVRAEDSTSASAGPSGGNQETNVTRLFATAFGPPGVTGTWHDDGGDTGAFLTPDSTWQISSTQAKSGTRSYHNAPDHDNYQNNTCASLITPAISLDANAELSYFARFNLEFQWDGVIVEISEDGGSTWAALAPNGGYPSTLAETQGDTGTQTPANACGYLKTTPAFTGPAGNDALTPWTEYRSSLASFSGKSVKIRWRFTSDPGAEFEGFYLDDIAIANAKLPGACVSIVVRPSASFDVLPGRPARGLVVTLADTSVNTPTSWLWDFGDGTATSTQQNPTHTYNSTGTFIVKLTATNAAGSDQVTKSITVEEPVLVGRRRSVKSR